MRKTLLSLLFLLTLCRLSYAGTISVAAFVTADDVTVTHLETQRTTFQGAINSADGGLLQTGTVTAGKLDANANPENRWNEAFADFVYSGLLPPTSGSLSSTTTAGTAFVNGARVVKDATAKTYTASKQTYVDLSSTGTYTYQEVAIGAAEPSVTSNSIRIARVSTDATTVLGVVDKRNLGMSTLTTKVGSISRTLDNPTESLSYTGVGFKPKAIIFIGGKAGATLNFLFWGWDDGTTYNTYSIYTTAGVYESNSVGSIMIMETSSLQQYAKVTSFDADGFTLSWTRAGTTSSGTATINYLALR